MTAIDDLLARAALLKNPSIPVDTVPYLDTCADLALAPSDAEVLSGEALADRTAAEQLRSLCEAAVTHTSAPQITDFITEQLPGPSGAWFLGCLLHLAAAEDGARFWWQYAAGAGHRGASYCLSLHHRARGDDHAAGFWLAQADDSPDTDQACEASTATVLRIVAQMTADTRRAYSESTLAAMSYTAAAVTDGYRLHPDVEIPAPGPYFAEMLQIILASSSAEQDDDNSTPSARPLPARPLEDDAVTRRSEVPPGHVLVQLAAPDAECASAFHAAVAPGWRQIPPEQPHTSEQREVLMRFLLDRRHFESRLVRAAHADEAAQA